MRKSDAIQGARIKERSKEAASGVTCGLLKVVFGLGDIGALNVDGEAVVQGERANKRLVGVRLRRSQAVVYM
ncbi:MAG TPA: hypothetical protein VFA28_01320 [Bryobacteraceae bacterium]|nr:hypothetical protein [Bryobacteraceae bacterium]